MINKEQIFNAIENSFEYDDFGASYLDSDTLIQHIENLFAKDKKDALSIKEEQKE